METISENEFIDYMADALPKLMSSIMKEDDTAVSQGHISLPQFWALHAIAENNQVTVNELAAMLDRGKSSTSALLDRLASSGLVQRSRCTSDRRIVRISLTDKGKDLIKRLSENRKKGILNTYKSLSGTERAFHLEMMKKILTSSQKIVLAMLLLLGSIRTASAQETTNSYTLRESIQIGLNQSITVANAARQREIAKATQKRALSAAYPQLTGTANYIRNFPEEIGGVENFSGRENRNVGAEATLQIFSGGRTLSAIRAAKAYKQLTIDQERRIRETQARDIALSYYDVQLANAQVEVLKESVKQLAAFEADTKLKYDAGTASEFNWLSAKVSLVNEEPLLMAAQNRLSLAKENFRNLTYIDAENFVLSDDLTYTPMQVNLDEVILIGLQRRPELNEKNSSINLRKEDINQQKSAYYPTVDLFAAYSLQNPDPYGFLTGQSGWQDYWNAGIRANWNLFDGGARQANVSESKLNMAIEEDQYRDMERTVSLQIRTQWLLGRDSAEVINATTENVELAERALEISLSRFNAGLSTNLEVTQSNLELSDARLARITALYEHMNAVTGIKYAAGILLEEYEDE